HAVVPAHVRADKILALAMLRARLAEIDPPAASDNFCGHHRQTLRAEALRRAEERIIPMANRGGSVDFQQLIHAVFSTAASRWAYSAAIPFTRRTTWPMTTPVKSKLSCVISCVVTGTAWS